MSLLSNSSISLLPDGGKAGKLYSLIPTDGLGDFTVVRALDTATRVNENGLIEVVPANTPRIDFAEGTGCGSLLVEPTRTNLVIDSQNYDPATTSWSNFVQGVGINPIITANAGISPDGTNNAFRLQCNIMSLGIPNRSAITTPNITVTTGQNGIVTAYIKSNTGTDQPFTIANSAFGTAQYIATNEWQKIELSVIASGSTTNIRIGLLDSVVDTTCDLLIYGFQLEQGSYPTSYIPTNGAAATRNADVISLSGVPQLLGDSEGTLMVESKAIDNDSTAKSLSLSDNSLNASYRLRYTSSNTLEYNLIDNGSTQFSLTDTVTDITNFSKNLFTYKNLDYKLLVDGNLKATNTSISNTGLNSLTTVGLNRGGSGEPFYGRIKSLLVYQAALNTDASEVLSGYATYEELAINKNYTIL